MALHRTPPPAPWRVLGVLCCALSMAVAGPSVSAAGTTDITGIGGVAYAPPAPIGEELPSGGASIGDATGTGTTTSMAAPVPALAGDETRETVDQLEGRTVAQLEALAGRLRGERDAAQVRLLAMEGSRSAAEARLDAAIEAWSAQLVLLYDESSGDRLRALVAVRDASDPATRATLTAALWPADRAIVEAQDRAAAAVDAAAERAEVQRARVLALGTRISAVELAIEARSAPQASARGARRGFAVDADLVFATGAIPGIGYWGAVSGGGMLSGWTGMAGAAVGGVGCTAPDPAMQPTGSIEQGEASWYGPGFHGQVGANGEVYDQNAMTAAHKTLPFGTIVRVYSSVTARCAFVRITDRGPYVDGRIIDLSRAAADAIGMESVAPVQVEVWSLPGGAAAAPPA